MTWTYAYRPRGTDVATKRRLPNRTVTIGNPETHSPDDARIEANRLKGRAAAGGDPASEKKLATEALRRKRGAQVTRLFDDYARALPKRPKMRGKGTPSPRYVREELSALLLVVDELKIADSAVGDLSIVDARRLLAGAGNHHARFGAFSRFLDWCQDVGHIQENPCTQIARPRRPKAPQARTHYLKPALLARLWKAADRLDEAVWRDLARFLIAMPCRRGEAARMEWSHLDLAAAEWRQPGHMTKNGDPHRLYLHPLALDVLRERQAATDGKGLVFPAPVSGSLVGTFSKMKVELSKSAGLSGWAWHDFRRSFVTALGEASIPEPVADAILNHRQSATRGGVMGVYQYAARWPEQVKAMELWERLLTAAIEGREADANVVPMTARAG